MGLPNYWCWNAYVMCYHVDCLCQSQVIGPQIAVSTRGFQTQTLYLPELWNYLYDFTLSHDAYFLCSFHGLTGVSRLFPGFTLLTKSDKLMLWDVLYLLWREIILWDNFTNECTIFSYQANQSKLWLHGLLVSLMYQSRVSVSITKAKCISSGFKIIVSRS